MRKNIKHMKRFLAIVMTSFFCFSSVNTNTKMTSVNAADESLNNPITDESGVTTWEKVKFGSYYQTKNILNEKIKWRILSIDGDDAFLISDKVLDYKAFNDSLKEETNTWEKSDIRVWLNETFYDKAFNEDEKKDIIETSIENKGISEIEPPGEDDEGGEPQINVIVADEANTSDNVFLLSKEEIINPAYGFDESNMSSSSRASETTDYTFYNGINANLFGGHVEGKVPWMLRSLQYTNTTEIGQDRLYYIYKDGGLYDEYSYEKKMGIRPAIHVNIKSENITAAGEITSGDEIISTSGDYHNPVVNDGITTWSCVYFGNYNQSIKFNKEPIEWRVLSVKDDKALLLTDKIIDSHKYNPSSSRDGYLACQIADWLVDDLFNAAFSDKEKESIVEVDMNPDYPGNIMHKIFLLSPEEVSNTEYGFGAEFEADDKSRVAYVTDYTEWMGSKGNSGEDGKPKGSALWWLTTDVGSFNANCIDWSGKGYSDTMWKTMSCGVRPAIYVDLSKEKLEAYETVDSEGNVKAVTKKEEKTDNSENTENKDNKETTETDQNNDKANPENPVNQQDGNNNGTQTDTSAPSSQNSAQNPVQTVQTTGSTVPSVGTVSQDKANTGKYVIINAATDGTGTVAYSAPVSKKEKNITIPDTVTIEGFNYQVTEIKANALKGSKKLKKVVIGKNISKIEKSAFENCKSLKNIIIKTTKLTKKSIGKKAFKGINNKAVFKCPKKKKSSYKKWIKKAGAPKSAKYK